jgi:type IV pilus assembly protein PilY1
MDLPTSGERVISEPALYDNRILFTTMIPNSAACGGGTGWLMELDSATGGALIGPTFDVDGDGDVDADDNLGTAGEYGSGVKKTSIPSAVRLQKNPGGAGGGTLLKPISLSKKDTKATVGGALDIDLNAMTSTQRRSSWRQLFE